MIVARALRSLGLKRALVVFSEDLKDEVSLSGKTFAALVDNKKITQFNLSPTKFGLKRISLSAIKPKNVKDSARMVKSVLNGKPGAARDIVLANAACAFFAIGKVKTLKEGVALAKNIIDSGLAKKKLTQFINNTKEK